MRIEAIGEQPPAIGRTRAAIVPLGERPRLLRAPAGFTARDPEFEVHRCGIRLLARERLENLEGRSARARHRDSRPQE